MEEIKFIDSSGENLILDLLKRQKQKTAALWAAACAEHVLKYFEKSYPKDKHPRKAIMAARAWAAGRINTGKARTASLAAHDSAKDAQEPACAAARSAENAAATAHVKNHAIRAADFAVDAVSFANPEKSDRIIKERNWQYARLLKMALQ